MAITVPIGSTQIVGTVNYNSVYSGYLQITANSIDITANTSNITVKWIYRKNASDPWGAWNNAGTSFVTLRVNGTSERRGASFDLRSSAIGSTLVLFEKTMTIAHDANGEKTINVGGLHETGLGGTGWGNQSVLDTLVILPSIPRSSSIGSLTASVTAGGAVTLGITRAVVAFTHRVVFALGVKQQVFTGVATTQTFTIPLDWCTALPNSNSGIATATVTTFNGATQIGNPVSRNFTVVVPANMLPTVGELTAAHGGELTPAAWGLYVQSKSKVLLKIASAAGAQGATIKSCTFVGDGYSQSNQWNGSTALTFTTGEIQGSGAIGYTVEIMDSRGRVVRSTVNITAQAYTMPTVLEASTCTRSTAGNAFHIYPNCTWASCGGKNPLSITARYKPTGGSWTDITGFVNKTSKTVSGISADFSYEVELTAADWFYAQTRRFMVNSTVSAIDLRGNGKGIAFGKAAETDNLIDCAWPVQLRQGLRLGSGGLELGGNHCPLAISTYDPTSTGQGFMITLPYTMAGDQMLCFTLNYFAGYDLYKIVFSGYLWQGNGNWYAPKARLMVGDTALRVAMGKDATGKAYVWVPFKMYPFLSVTDISSGYQPASWGSGWTIVRTNTPTQTALDTTLSPQNNARMASMMNMILEGEDDGYTEMETVSPLARNPSGEANGQGSNADHNLLS